MRVAACQIAPVFLDRAATVARVVDWIGRAAGEGVALVAFGETLVPGYPAWLDRTDGARFNSDLQKRFHARYLEQAVTIEDGHLQPICDAARKHAMSVVIGVAERPRDRGGTTIYCSCVFIRSDGTIGSIHRKLMPTYEERLAWGTGDGHGLVTHEVDAFTVGALNCWENWMPLARASLYAQGETLHVAIWPGCVRNTVDITRMIAAESRSFVISASALLRESDLPADLPERARIAGDGETLNNGGSCIAGPDGEWIAEPLADEEGLIIADLDAAEVLRERQNFDPSGHYARPDVLRLVVDRRRQQAAEFVDDDEPGDSGSV